MMWITKRQDAAAVFVISGINRFKETIVLREMQHRIFLVLDKILRYPI